MPRCCFSPAARKSCSCKLARTACVAVPTGQRKRTCEGWATLPKQFCCGRYRHAQRAAAAQPNYTMDPPLCWEPFCTLGTPFSLMRSLLVAVMHGCAILQALAAAGCPVGAAQEAHCPQPGYRRLESCPQAEAPSCIRKGPRLDRWRRQRLALRQGSV
jgi:hypothetical protein